MKDITLSEFLKVVHNQDIEQLEKIECQYNISVRYNVGLWYGDKITIENAYNYNNVVPMEKEDILEQYYKLSRLFPDEDLKEKTELLNLIANNGWMEDYINTYEYGTI